MPSIALSDLRAKLLDRLDGNSVLYSNPELDYIINEAIRCTVLFTGFYRAAVELPDHTVANQLIYDVPSSIICTTSVAFEGRQLKKASLKRLAEMRRNWARDTVTVKGPMEFWSPIGTTKVVLNPIDDAGGHDLTFTGIATPDPLTAASDVMDLENEYVDLILEYGAHRLPLKEGGKVFADGSLQLNTFYSKMNERRRLQKLKLPKYRLIQPRAPEAQS